MKTPREKYSEYLGRHAQSLDPEREAVLDAVFENHHHFTVDELAGAVGMPAAGAPALIDVLDEMVEAGLIRKVYFGGAAVNYEHVHGHVHHDHLYCLGCGKIVEFRNDAIERLQDEIAREHGFHVVRHSQQIVGLCDQCQKRDVPHEHEYVPDEDRRGPTVPLSLVRNGEWATLVDLNGGLHFRGRLAALGLTKGDRFQVVSNSFAGPIRIRVRDTNLALGHGMGHKIFVRIEQPD